MMRSRNGRRPARPADFDMFVTCAQNGLSAPDAFSHHAQPTPASCDASNARFSPRIAPSPCDHFLLPGIADAALRDEIEVVSVFFSLFCFGLRISRLPFLLAISTPVEPPERHDLHRKSPEGGRAAVELKYEDVSLVRLSPA